MVSLRHAPTAGEQERVTMGELKIAITYDGPLDTGVDDRLRKAMESIGGKWYAQGTDRTTGVRD